MTVYSQQARSMSEQYYVKLEEAQGWINRHRKTYNVFHTWADEMSDLGSARGWIETAYPSRVRFTNELNAKGGEGSGPASVNHCIQGFAANVTKLAGIYVLDYAQSTPILMLSAIHDELLVATPGKVTLNLEKSKFDKEGVLTYAHYEPDEEAIKWVAPVVLLMEYAETELFKGELQGKAEATPAPYWAKKGLELSGQDFIDQYSGLINERLLETRVKGQ